MGVNGAQWILSGKLFTCMLLIRRRPVTIAPNGNSPKTRSTPRAQTSSVPSLRSIKQFIQARNGLANCVVCPYPDNIGKSTHPSLRNFANKHGLKIGKLTLHPRNLTDHHQNVQDCLCVTSCKFHKKKFIPFTVMLLTYTLRRLDGRPWNSLCWRETVWIIISWVVHGISWKSPENPFTRFA